MPCEVDEQLDEYVRPMRRRPRIALDDDELSVETIGERALVAVEPRPRGGVTVSRVVAGVGVGRGDGAIGTRSRRTCAGTPRVVDAVPSAMQGEKGVVHELLGRGIAPREEEGQANHRLVLGAVQVDEGRRPQGLLLRGR